VTTVSADPAVVAAARANRAIDALHAMLYFAPEADEELTKIGLRPGRMCYFASRSAAMGPVPAGVTTATFYNFNPTLVARYIPRAWGLASIEDILAARLTAADRALRRLLGGDEAAGSPAVAEAAELARDATVGLRPHGRPLYAGHADLDWPEEPHLVLWHAVTLLREYRGDGHVAVLLAAQVTGLDALITHTATGRGFTVAAAKNSRGWSDAEWAAAEARLREHGLLDGAGLTVEGAKLRESIEAATDDIASDPWRRLGADRTDRLVELGRALSRQLVNAGAFPADTFARR
jgi:hypothetical protein